MATASSLRVFSPFSAVCSGVTTWTPRQVNTLQQLQNVSSYGMLRRGLSRGEIHIHALWFDIYTGNIHYFSRRQKRFIDVNEDSLPQISEEVRTYHSSGL